VIPVTLTLKGFLSYRDEVTVDLSPVEVACVSGPNGAGKSSLLDALTWVLFGRARRSDDALIHGDMEACAVTLKFEIEGNRYRVMRSKARDKGVMLEFQVCSGEDDWKPLTEAGVRSTEERIREVLRLDYETFVNASFFLQGKADIFARQTAGSRKEILGSILGLEIWETYREEAARRRRGMENEVKGLRTWLAEIDGELGEERERVQRLALLQDSLGKTAALREEKGRVWQSAQTLSQELRKDAEKLELMDNQLKNTCSRLKATDARIGSRETELREYEQLLTQSGRIEKEHADWQALRMELERQNALAMQIHDLKGKRATVEATIQAEEARLRQELAGLEQTRKDKEQVEIDLPGLIAQHKEMESRGNAAEAAMAEYAELEKNLTDLQEQMAELKAHNASLKAEMDKIKERMDRLVSAEGKSCPLCGQDLSEKHRSEMLASLEREGNTLGDQHRANLEDGQRIAGELETLKARMDEVRAVRDTGMAAQKALGELSERIDTMRARLEKWDTIDLKRYQDISNKLEKAAFAIKERKIQRELDDALKALGYDESAHQTIREKEKDARKVEEEFRALEKARATVDGLRREVEELKESRQGIDEEITSQALLYEDLRKRLSEQKEGLPDLNAIEAELNELREEENRLRRDVGGAQQMVDVLETQRRRKKELQEQIEEQTRDIARLKILETAFGRDGIPALLIEQALPEIEGQANELLDRLSGGNMSVSFETERAYKDKRREDRRQTLEILISDASGQREYELFSGGEAFRIDFAIRLALSRVLAGRAGARLQTLVIDEGFGSQDADGRQRLIEAINQVSPDFAKILVITHLDELKDAFQSRIEVSKTDGSSRVEVLP